MAFDRGNTVTVTIRDSDAGKGILWGNWKWRGSSVLQEGAMSSKWSIIFLYSTNCHGITIILFSFIDCHKSQGWKIQAQINCEELKLESDSLIEYFYAIPGVPCKAVKPELLRLRHNSRYSSKVHHRDRGASRREWRYFISKRYLVHCMIYIMAYCMPTIHTA